MDALLSPPRPTEKIQFQLWAYKIKHWLRHGVAELICLTVAAACLFHNHRNELFIKVVGFVRINHLAKILSTLLVPKN